MRWLIAIALILAVKLPAAWAWQGGVVHGPVEEWRDRELEKQSLHHLQVARFYFKKKRWAAARGRLQEIVARNPRFAGMAEVYYMLGEVYAQTNEPEQAQELFSRVVEEFPDSEFAGKAKARLEQLARKM
ncbi:MAG: tetratricopeptide repeat protein [Acidobacteriota bacterium]|nr:tetratricopeptide repeat protein [Blastocatellia bacterium]MDW8239973.1 tetratricopeptide repeat protein [Acidobacteriota bacterium]